jgi:3-phenylpropionate/trans-cinnamate dioxygenase ferredoxin reductase subunit
VLIAGARRLPALYMTPALIRLARMPNVTIIPTIEEGQSPSPAIRLGRIEAHVPPLDVSDVVYACGSPRMVNTLAGLVETAGATFYADPFESAGPDEPQGLLGKLRTLVARSPSQQSDEAIQPGGIRATTIHARASLQPEPPHGEVMRAHDHVRAVHPRARPVTPAGQQDNSRPSAAQFASGHA